MRNISTGIALGMLLWAVNGLEAQVGGWMDPAWAYRDQVTVLNPGGTALTNFEVHVTPGGSFAFGQASSGGSDIRFTASDGTTQIPFWIENWNVSASTASIWVRIPSIPITGTTIYLYYGNPSAVSASNGTATFEFFDDFSPSANDSQGYFKLSSPQTALVQSQNWEGTAPHTLSVIQMNGGSSTYWGYYGLQDSCLGVGLAFSNDLVNWTKSAANPLFNDARWPSVLTVNGTIYMAYEKNYCSGPSYIVLATSTDGIIFTDLETLVQPQTGFRNQNPSLFFNPSDGKYYLYWYYGDDASQFHIKVRSAALPAGLNDSSGDITLFSSNTTLAAPNMLTYAGRYYLSTEVYENATWETKVYAGSSPTGSFSLLPGNPVIGANTACMFQQVLGGTLHAYTCKLSNDVWTVEHRTASLTGGWVTGPNVTKWPLGAQGYWQLVQDTQEDGTTGQVVLGTTTASQVMPSLFSGTDYVVEAYGKQISGTVWGLGARAADQNNQYLANLYDNLNTSSNLFGYKRINGAVTATLGSAAVGPVSPNAWYKLAVKVHGSAIGIYKDDVSQIQTTDASLSSGSVALYGEANSVAEYNNLRVRQYAAVDPTATVSTTPAGFLASLVLNPNPVLGGTTAVGTVTLAASAPAGGLTIALSSTNSSVAAVPASILVAAGATSGSFNITTPGVQTSATATISARYNNQTQSATLTVSPVLSSLTLNPTTVVGGNTSAGTVTLATAAPTGGVTVGLSSTNSALGAVPASVTVAEGAHTGQFTVATSGVTQPTAITIMATYNGSSVTAGLTINPLVSSLALNPATVIGGNTSIGTVTLSGAAPVGGTAVTLSSSNSAVSAVPASVTVAAGATSATFPVTTVSLTQSTTVTVTATYKGASLFTGLTVNQGSGAAWFGPSWLYRSAVTVTNAGGTPLTGYEVQVRLGASFTFANVRSDGADLRFSDADGATALPYWIENWSPAQQSASLWVRVPAIGASGATIYLYYGNSSASTSTASGSQTFEFFDDFSSATLNGARWTASGGTWSIVSDTRPDGTTGNVARGVTTANQLLSSSYSGTDYVVQAYGKQVSGRVWGLGARASGMGNLYSANLYDDLNTTNNFYLYRWVNNAASTLADTAVGTVSANAWYKLALKVHGTSIMTYKDDLLQAQATDAAITSGTIALYGEQGTTAEFNNVFVRQYTAVEPTVTVGGASQSGLPAVASVSLSPASVLGGSSSSGTVTLSGPAPVAAVVALSSNPTGTAQVPASVTVPVNGTSATFTATTSSVSQSGTVTITATYNGSSQAGTLTVTPAPPTLVSVTLAPAALIGGNSSQGTVTLSTAALTGGAVVTLLSGSPAAAVAANVTIAAGATTATFPVATSSVTQSTLVTITASYNGVSQMASLTVNQGSGSAWFNTSWLYRSAVTMTNGGGTPLSNYEVHVTLGSSFDFTKVRSDGADLRFADADGATALPYWIENWSPAQQSASLWVRVPAIASASGTIYLYYGNSSVNSSTASGSRTFEFFDDFSSPTLNSANWTASGGTWSVVSDAMPNGATGNVARGVMTANQILSSSYSGTDYVLQAYGKQVSGRVWGVGARASGATNLYSANLYDDLNSTKNLYLYRWTNKTASTLASAAVGTVGANSWYKLTVKAHGSSIDVFKDDVLQEQGVDSTIASGTIALYGEQGTTAEFNNVFVRQYTSTEPTVAVGTAVHQ